MATKPTRLQEQACERLAEALLLIGEGVRLDGKGAFDSDDLSELARRMARASSAFGLDEIVASALEKRVRALGLPSSTGELLTLLEAEVRPLEMLLLTDDALKELVGKMEEELGGF